MTKEYLERQFENYHDYVKVRHKYNVQEYGVVPMSDATATTNALKALIELADAGSVLYFPAGVYTINDAITITKRLAFVGEESTTKAYKSTSNDNLPLSQIKVADNFPANGTLFTKTANSVCTFTNLAFFCHGFYHQHENDAEFTSLPYPFFVIDTPTVAGVNGIDASTDGLFTINNCYFEGFSGYALKLKQHRFVDNCGFMRCTIGIEIAGTDSWISNCWFSGSNDGIHVPSTLGSTLLSVSDTWCDAMAGHFINCESSGSTVLLVSNAWVDLLDKCAIYVPNSQLVSSMIEGRFSRCGMTYAGLEDADWTQEKSPLADTIYAWRIVQSEINVTVQRRAIGIGNRPEAECPAHLIGMGTEASPNNSFVARSTIIAPDLKFERVAPTQPTSVSDFPVFKLGFSDANIYCIDGIFRPAYTNTYVYPFATFRNTTPIGKVKPAHINDFAVDSSTGNIYRSTDTTDNTKWELISCKPDNAKLLIVKTDTLPTASVSELGNTYIYMGTTDLATQKIHGAIYECISDGAATPTYSWKAISIPMEGWKAIVSQCNDFADFKTLIENF